VCGNLHSFPHQNMGNAATKGAAEQNCGLAGEWVPTRKSEWKNRNIGTPHALRAAMPQTKMTYSENGSGKGWVGELWVTVQAWTLAPGQYSSTAKVAMLLWSASDGNMTVHSDGTLEVRYPSNGILEYWKRTGSTRPTQSIIPSPVLGGSNGTPRPLMLLLRRVDSLGMTWHWALGVGTRSGPLSIYEVGGADNAILGPKGAVCGYAIPSKAKKMGTKIDQFSGYIMLEGRSTKKSDTDIEVFCRAWRQRHPLYNLAGPNCQTFSEDLHIFLTGQNLEFHKVADLQRGPETLAEVIWLDPTKKPRF